MSGALGRAAFRPDQNSERERLASLRIGIAAVGLLGLGLLVQLPIYNRSVVPMDEGHLAAAVDWIIQGKALYREIHTGIVPAIYYITAFLFSLFEPDLVVTRWAQVFVNTTIALCLWRLASRVVRPYWAALPPLLYLILIVVSFPVLTMFNYSTLAMGFGLAALLFLLRYLESARIRDGIALGLLLGACVLTKQNFGVLASLAVLAGLLWNRHGSSLEGRSLSVLLWPVAASGGALTLLAIALLAHAGLLFDFLDATLVSLGSSQIQFFNNPIPPLIGSHPSGDGRFIFLYSPPTLFNYLMRGEPILGLPISPLLLGLAIRLSYIIPLTLLSAGPLVLWLTRNTDPPGKRRGSRAIVLFSLFFFPGIFPSAIWSHLAFVVPPILLVASLVGDRVDLRLTRGRRPAAWIWRALIATIAVGGALCTARIAHDIRRWYPIPLEVPRASLLVSTDQAALYRGATEFLDRCADPGEPIFVAPDLPILYFLANRPNPTPYDLTIPGNVDGPLIADLLQAQQTRCLVYNPRMYPEFPPFEQLFPDLDHYLRTNYERAEVIKGGDTVWYGLTRRKEAKR